VRCSVLSLLVLGEVLGGVVGLTLPLHHHRLACNTKASRSALAVSRTMWWIHEVIAAASAKAC
jgi:hypothetical protein